VWGQSFARRRGVGADPIEFLLDRVDVRLQRLLRKSWVFPMYETDPSTLIDPLQIVGLLRPIPQFHRSDVPRISRPTVPALGPIHRRIHLLSVYFARMGV